VEGLRPLAEGLQMTLSQLALAWILRRSEATAAIVGFRDPEQVAEIAAAADCTLDGETVRKIRELTDRLPPLFE
jgi:aryl-alcohol dehydrogenase-like predicted oxidoreductase